MKEINRGTKYSSRAPEKYWYSVETQDPSLFALNSLVPTLIQ